MSFGVFRVCTIERLTQSRVKITFTPVPPVVCSACILPESTIAGVADLLETDTALEQEVKNPWM